MKDLNYIAPTESHMLEFAKRLSGRLVAPCVIFLHGDLGAGKTTLSRGIIQSFGHSGSVKSPTYTLVEPYELAGIHIYHFDLYRLADAEELEYMGIRDYFLDNCICIIEWPGNGGGILPCADIEIDIQYLDAGRSLRVWASTNHGIEILKALESNE